jgi:hypothetical protein
MPNLHHCVAGATAGAKIADATFGSFPMNGESDQNPGLA